MLAGIVLAVYAIRVVGVSWRGGFPPTFPDSSSYLRVARAGPFGSGFWFGERPIGAPLLYWAVGRNVRLIVLAQLVIHLAAFAAVAAVVRRSVATVAARAVGTVSVVALAMEPRFGLWDTLVLSESLSISAGAMSIAAWTWFAHRPSVAAATGAWAATFAFALVRDSNALIAVVVVAPAAFAASKCGRAIGPEPRRRLKVGAFVMVGLAGYVAVAQSESGRSSFPTFNVIGQRVLADDDLLDWYVMWGMPDDAAVRGRLGRDSWDDGEAFLRAPELAHLREWQRSRGSIAHVSSMVRFAPRFASQVWNDLPSHLATDHEAYDLFAVHDRLPRSIVPSGWTGPRSESSLVVWIGVGVVALVGLFSAGRRGPAAVLALAFVATALDVYVSWHGDSVEVQRHLVGSISRLSIVCVVTAVLGGDAWLASYRRARVGGDESGERDEAEDERAAVGRPTSEDAGVV